MSLTRKRFLLLLAGGAWTLAATACGGGDDDDAPPLTCSGTIALNHGHVLVIPEADLDATTARTYDIAGSAGHAHTVTFTPAQLAALKAGSTVTVTSSLNSGHSHEVGSSCR